MLELNADQNLIYFLSGSYSYFILVPCSGFFFFYHSFRHKNIICNKNNSKISSSSAVTTRCETNCSISSERKKEKVRIIKLGNEFVDCMRILCVRKCSTGNNVLRRQQLREEGRIISIVTHRKHRTERFKKTLFSGKHTIRITFERN